MRRALVTGILGQDGAYLSRLLRDKGYEVWGTVRDAAPRDDWRLRRLAVRDAVTLVPVDLAQTRDIVRLLDDVRPDEIYNLAAQSFVGLSFEKPVDTADLNGVSVARILEAIRAAKPDARFYQASSSEMFGRSLTAFQTEESPFQPCSPYAIAKLYGHLTTVNYREAYGLHASAGILFNHESPLRPLELVTRKITATMARLRDGDAAVLELGNMNARRDWGFAGDYVEGMWRMLQQPQGGDYVLATGRSATVRDFVLLAARAAGFDLTFEGEGPNEIGIDRQTNRTLVRVNPRYFRPVDVDVLVGDASKARDRLGWTPTLDFEGLVEMMVRADVDARRAARSSAEVPAGAGSF